MDPSTLDLDEFLALAVARKMIGPDEADEIAYEAKRLNTCGSVVALQRGFLDAVEIDVLQTLLHPESTIPGYQIVDYVGRGGMGVVYRARQTSLGRQVALKTILASRLSEPAAVERFEQEARAVARLNHPHIVTAYDFGKVEGRVYLAMEFLVGEDLEHFLGKVGRLSRPVAWGIARQAAGALAHAAQFKIVHRDVKPGNLFLVKRPEGFPIEAGLPMVKIMDFGLAFLSESSERRARLTADGQALGTPAYLAPEQVTGKPVDHRADVYALGATIYQCLTGKIPYSGRSAVQVIGAKAAGEPLDLEPLRCCADPNDVRLIAEMTAYDPQARPSDYIELIARINELAGPDHSTTMTVGDSASTAAMPTVGPPATSPSAVRRIRRRITRRSMIVGSSGLAGMIAMGAWVWRTATSPPKADPMQTVREFRLFDEKSLSPAEWKFHRGGWRIVQDDEKEAVIRGLGRLGRVLPTDHGSLPKCYRIIVGVELLESTTVELRFALIGDSSDRPKSWYALHVEPERGVWLAVARDGNPARRESPIVPLPVRSPEASNFRQLRADRRLDEWLVYIDDVLVGTHPTRPAETIAEFQLDVEGGEAQFADVEMEVLRPMN